MMDGVEHSVRINVKPNILQSQCEVEQIESVALSTQIVSKHGLTLTVNLSLDGTVTFNFWSPVEIDAYNRPN